MFLPNTIILEIPNELHHSLNHKPLIMVLDYVSLRCTHAVEIAYSPFEKLPYSTVSIHLISATKQHKIAKTKQKTKILNCLFCQIP
jgi:hypothetical protein